MLHVVHAIIKAEFVTYVDDEKCKKDNAQIVREAKDMILGRNLEGMAEIMDDFEIEEQDIEAIWLNHSIPD